MNYRNNSKITEIITEILKYQKGGQKGWPEKVARKTTQKTTQKILEEIQRNPEVSRTELAVLVGLTSDGIKYHLNKMKLVAASTQIA